ncbi:MAG: hypothetical protein ACSHWS_14435 [Sulfitobacter sp.]
MSAPDTDLEKQERRHKAPLLGMKSIIIFAALMLVALVLYTMSQSDDGETEAVSDSVPTVDVTVDN